MRCLQKAMSSSAVTDVPGRRGEAAVHEGCGEGVAVFVELAPADAAAEIPDGVPAGIALHRGTEHRQRVAELGSDLGWLALTVAGFACPRRR